MSSMPKALSINDYRPRAAATRIKSSNERTNDSTERASRDLGKCLRKFAPAADDRAADLLLARCRKVDAAACDDEIMYFLAIKAQQAVASRRVHNLTGFLIWAVPQCFGGAMVEDYREARRADLDREVAAWQAVADDPREEAEFRERARQELSRLADAAHTGAHVAPAAARR